MASVDQRRRLVRPAGTDENVGHGGDRVRPVWIKRECLSGMEFRLVVAPATELNLAEGRVAYDLLGVED